MCQSFFVHSSFNRPLGCFHVFTALDCAVIKIWLHIAFNMKILLQADKNVELKYMFILNQNIRICTYNRPPESLWEVYTMIKGVH